MMFPITGLKPQSLSSAFNPLMIHTTFSGGVPQGNATTHLYQPCPGVDSELNFHHQHQRLLPTCSPGISVLNSHYLRRCNSSELAFVPLSHHDKDSMFSGGFASHFGGFQSGLLPLPVKDEKPNQSYIGLIGKAILSSPQKKLVLSDIYNFVLTHYPYFRNKGPGWRNSIRHNLSLNECFLKVGRSPNGKGHYWAINPANLEDFSKGEYRRKRAHKRNKISTQMCDDPAKLKQVHENLIKNSAPHSRGCRKEGNSVNQDKKSSVIIEKRPTQPQNEGKRGFYIETLLGAANTNRDLPLKDTKPVENSKENSAFSVVSHTVCPQTVSSPMWSHHVAYPGYSRQLNTLANCSSKIFLTPSSQ